MVQDCWQLQTLNLKELRDINSFIVTPQTFLTDAIALMSQQHSSCVLIEEQQQLTGIFTERDLVKLTASNRAIAGIAISEVMTEQPITVSTKDKLNLIELISLLGKHSIRHLPLVDAWGKPLGVITHRSLRTALKANYLLKQQQVKEVMNAEVVCTSSDRSIFQIANLMATHQVSCVAIVETEAEDRVYPMGIVTERDLVQFRALGLDLHHLPIQEVMSIPLFPISADALLWDAHNLMEQHHVRRLIITNPKGTLAGIITQSSILQALDLKNIYAGWQTLAELLQERTEQLEAKIAQQKLLQQKLTLSQAKLRSILASITDIVLILDESGKDIEVLSMSSPSSQLKSDLIDKTLKQFWHTETTDTFLSQVRQVIQTQQTIDFEYDIWLEKRHFWFTAQIAPMPDGNSAIWIARDITSKKQAQLALQVSHNELEQQVFNRTQELSLANAKLKQEIRDRLASQKALQESEQKFHAIFNQTFQFIGLLKPDGTIVEANQTSLDFGGLKPEDVVGKPFWETNWWQISTATQTQLKQAIARASQGEFIRYQVDIWGKNQQQITIDFSIKPITDENGKVVWLIPEGRDISDRLTAETERQRLLDRIKQERRFLTSVIQQMPVGVIIAQAPSGKLIFSNDRVATILRHPLKPITKIVEYEQYGGLQADGQPFKAEDYPIVKALSKGETITGEEINYLCGDGSIRTLSVNAAPVCDRTDKIIAGIATFYDITELKQAREIQKDANNKAILIKEIHHRIKNNLQIVSTLLDLQWDQTNILDTEQLLEESQARIQTIALIHEQLYASASLEKINFLDYIQSLIDYLHSSFIEEKKQIAVVLDVEQIYLDIDLAIPCGLIINELVINALQHGFISQPRGAIKISCYQIDSDRISLIVRDNGIGIPENMNIENIRTLGLSLVNSLAKDQLEGTIEIQRVNGTLFKIEFPIL